MPRKKNLAIVTQDPANYGGVLRLVEYVYRRAESAGFQPELLHYGRFGEHPELSISLASLMRGEINLAPKEKRYLFRGLRARALGAWFPEWEPQRLRANALWTRALAEYDAAFLVTGSAQTGLPLSESERPFAAWISSIVEDDRRERIARSSSISETIERWGMPSVLRAEKKVIDSARRIFAVSAQTSEALKRIASKPIERWPFPIDTEKFHPTVFDSNAPKQEKTIRFLFVGRANDPRKRIELFFDAGAAFHSQHRSRDFTAIVISSTLSTNREYPFPIEWLSGVSDAELIAHYRSATALILTSEQEGLGIAAMEAMACGTPVISTRCGGPETFIDDGENGFFVDDNPSAIAEKMAIVATDPKLRERMGHSAGQHIDMNFSERVWNEKFEHMLRSL